MRCLKKAEQRGNLLFLCCSFTEIVPRQICKPELFLRCEFPGQLQLDRLAQCKPIPDQLGGGRLVKLEQQVGGLDLDPFAAFQLNLR